MDIKAKGLLKNWIDKYRQNPFIVRMMTILSLDVLARLSNIILLPVYLRLMSQEEYGLYNYILSIVTTFSMVLNFGLYVSQTKYYSDYHLTEKRKIVLFNIVILLTFLLAIVIVPAYLLGFDYKIIKLLFKEDIGYSTFRWPLMLAVLVAVYALVLSNYFVTTERIRLYRKYNLYRLILVNVVVLVCLYFINESKIFVRLFYTYICELAVLLVFITYYFREMLPVLDIRMMWNFLKLGIPVMVSAISGLIGNYSDKFFLEKIGTAKDLSYYYLAFSVANVLYMICLALQNSWLPTFLKEKNLADNVRRTKKVMRQMVLILSGIGVMLIFAFWLALKCKIIAPKYTPALSILPFLMAAQIINGLVLLYSNYMIYFEKTHYSLFIGIVTSLVGLAISYFLVPIWGIYGAVTSYLTVQIAYLLLYYRIVGHQLAKRSDIHQSKPESQ